MAKILRKFKRKAVKILPVFIVFSIAAIPAQAGVFDWLSRTAEINTAEASSSLVFAHPSFGIGDLLKSESESESTLATLGGGFVLSTNSPEKTSAAKQPEKFREMTVSATAYSSTPDQTDDTPFVTAWNTHVRDGIVAANFLPFGTKIKIPEIYGDKVFVVEDRMNRRYWHKIDIWFPDRQSALQFGIKNIRIQILES